MPVRDLPCPHSHRSHNLAKMMKSLLCLAILVAVATADVVDVEDCGSRGTIFEVQFDGCDEVPCEVHHGETVHGRLQFESDVAADTLTCKLYAIIGGVEVEFPGGCPRVDACADLNEGDCPIEVGEYFEYEMTMYIDPSFPTTEVIGKWTLKDEASENVVCFTIPIDINP